MSTPITPYLVILRLKSVLVRTGLSRSTVYNKLNPKSPHYDPTFPKSIRISQGIVGWVESELDAWITARIEASRGKAA